MHPLYFSYSSYLIYWIEFIEFLFVRNSYHYICHIYIHRINLFHFPLKIYLILFYWNYYNNKILADIYHTLPCTVKLTILCRTILTNAENDEFSLYIDNRTRTTRLFSNDRCTLLVHARMTKFISFSIF